MVQLTALDRAWSLDLDSLHATPFFGPSKNSIKPSRDPCTLCAVYWSQGPLVLASKIYINQFVLLSCCRMFSCTSTRFLLPGIKNGIDNTEELARWSLSLQPEGSKSGEQQCWTTKVTTAKDTVFLRHQLPAGDVALHLPNFEWISAARSWGGSGKICTMNTTEQDEES